MTCFSHFLLSKLCIWGSSKAKSVLYVFIIKKLKICPWWGQRKKQVCTRPLLGFPVEKGQATDLGAQVHIIENLIHSD